MWRFAWVGVVCSWAAVSWAEAPVQFQLENGLQVVVQRDDRAPVALTQVWYRVGSLDEPAGKTGLSHLLEHMMFRGTAKVPNGAFSRIVDQFGGSDNAFTTTDHTVYFQRVLSDRVELALELEADRMKGLQLTDEAAFERERQVVIEERRQRVDDRPTGVALEQFRALALPQHPAGQPVIGTRADLDALTLADLRAWYDTWYVPNNAVLVVVGRVDPEQVRTWVQQYFGALPARPLPERAAPRVTTALTPRHQDLALAVQVPTLYLAFNVPSWFTAARPDDAIALQLLSAVLDGGISARLERGLVRTGQAASVAAGYDVLSRGDTLFSIHAVPVSGQSLSALQDAVLAQVQTLIDEPVVAAERQRVVAGLRAERVFARDSLDDQASLYGLLASLSLPLDWQDQLAVQLPQVSAEALQRMAQQVFQAERRTTLHLMPATGAQP